MSNSIKVIDITHFIENKVSSKLTVDVIKPAIYKGKYVKPSYFFVKLMTEGQSMKLSLQEMTELISRLQVAVDTAIKSEYTLRDEIDKSA